jgi:titin
LFKGPNTRGNVVSGDDIGTDRTGGFFLGDGKAGVEIASGAAKNTVGGVAFGSGDVISGNIADNIAITDPGTTGNVIEGDLIGTDASGTRPLAETLAGVAIANSATANTVGGTVVAARDVISGNHDEGVLLEGASKNVVEGDYIGTDVYGTASLRNFGNGITLEAGATANTIGGTAAAARDVVSGNSRDGLVITGAGTSSNVIEGDYIGLSASGNAMGNEGPDMLVEQGRRPTRSVGPPRARGTSSRPASRRASPSPTWAPRGTWSRATSSAPIPRACTGPAATAPSYNPART